MYIHAKTYQSTPQYHPLQQTKHIHKPCLISYDAIETRATYTSKMIGSFTQTHTHMYVKRLALIVI